MAGRRSAAAPAAVETEATNSAVLTPEAAEALDPTPEKKEPPKKVKGAKTEVIRQIQWQNAPGVIGLTSGSVEIKGNEIEAWEHPSGLWVYVRVRNRIQKIPAANIKSMVVEEVEA